MFGNTQLGKCKMHTHVGRTLSSGNKVVEYIHLTETVHCSALVAEHRLTARLSAAA